MSEQVSSVPARADTIAILGAGVMGEALLSGWLRGGRDAATVLISDRSEARTEALTGRYGVQALPAEEAAAAAGTLVIAVKPQDMRALLEQIGPRLGAQTLVVSLAAGITTAFLESHLPDGTSVARVMPNTPALVDQGMSAVSPGAHCDTDQLATATRLLSDCGKVISLPEHYLDAVTAISGSGPAYIFYVVEAMIEAGVLLGIPRATSTELVVQTVYGAATMLKETGQHPTVLREQVSSPGGTTMAALRQLDDNKVRAAFLTAIESAAHRSAELAGGS
ncbi:pyrroline-5-carboxylate reductase [Dermatophilaceae bacterium Sec6.4]